MNLHEYQGKMLLKKYGVPVPEGSLAFTAEEAVQAAKNIQYNTGSSKWVIKAQIHAGGRGKGGGVKVAESLQEVKTVTAAMIGARIVTPQTDSEGKLVRKVLLEQDIYYAGESKTLEFYFSILLNRSKRKLVIMYSPCGGMDIEAVAAETPDKIFYEEINPAVGLQAFQCRKIAFNLGLSGKAFKEMLAFVQGAYRTYSESDASLLEINPVIKTSDNHIFAADCKLVIDNSALFRKPEILEMRDFDEEDPTDVEAGRLGLNFIKLNGNCGCMVNGAGLAMATMDIIKQSGGEPANFLDVGGTANAKRVEEGFRIILKDENVKAILVNIFGGIVRCDRVATGLVDAFRNLGEIRVPIIVRLQGTKAEEGAEIIKQSGYRVYSVTGLNETAELVSALVR